MGWQKGVGSGRMNELYELYKNSFIKWAAGDYNSHAFAGERDSAGHGRSGK